MTFDEIRIFCDALKASGLEVVPFRWGITEGALVRDAGPPAETLVGTNTDSQLTRYDLGSGDTIWIVDLIGPNDRDGVALFEDRFALATPKPAAQGRAIEAWLDANRDAYDLFEPIQWSAAPERARTAHQWMEANWARLMDSPLKDSPLKALYLDLHAAPVRATSGNDG